jgi:hypothetical protein
MWMELINNLEAAVNLVKIGETEQERLKIINKLLQGELNYGTKEGLALMHRRALLMTMLREQEIWGHPVRR